MPVVNYVWDVVSDNVLMETDDEGGTIARYVQEPELYGEAISQERDGQVRYYNYDGLGDTVELTDENQDVTDTYQYSAFGEEIARTGTTENPFRYKGALGYYTDSETEDVYVRARTYQPAVARWLSLDPLQFVDGLNGYVYAGNAPADFVDGSGTLKVDNVGGPPIDSCDAPQLFKFDFIFETLLTRGKKTMPGAPCIGYVVQKVTVKCFIKKCSCPGDCTIPTDDKEFDHIVYWEAWDVPKYKDKVTDDVRLGVLAERCGSYEQKGEIKFFCRNKRDARRITGDEDDAIGPIRWPIDKRGFCDTSKPDYNRECCTAPGKLMATTKEDLVKFWDKTPAEGPARRSVVGTWNCCNSVGEIEIKLDPT